MQMLTRARRMRLTPSFIITAVLAGCLVQAAPALAQTAPGPSTTASLYLAPAYSETADPSADLELAKRLAKAGNKRILLEVGGDWCVWCHLLDDFLAGDAKAREAMSASFIVMKVNWSPDNRNSDFLGRYPKIGGYPHFIVLHTDGSFLASQDTATFEKGKSYNSKKLIAFAKKWDLPD